LFPAQGGSGADLAREDKGLESKADPSMPAIPRVML